MDNGIIPPHKKNERGAGMDMPTGPAERQRRCRCGGITQAPTCPHCALDLAREVPQCTCAACGLLLYGEALPPFCPVCGGKI